MQRRKNYREGKLRKKRATRAWEQQVGCGALGPHLGAIEIWFRRLEV